MGMVLSQKKFTHELLTACPYNLSRVTSTPLPTGVKLLSDSGDLYDDPALYRCLVGKLNFLTHTRLDLAFAVQTLSQFMHAPRVPHVHALAHTLKYVKCTIGQGILLKATAQLTLQAYSDSDRDSCPRKSASGYVLLLGQPPISWKSRKQSTLSKSFSEAEYRALAHAASEVTWLVRLLEELGINNLKPVTLHCDNPSALHIAKNLVFHERTKPIGLDCHFTRDKVLEGFSIN